MFSRLPWGRGKYPRQFWLMFWGMLISTVGSSMVWPFLMIYVSERLHLPLATAASLTTVNALTGLAAGFAAGPIADRLGRKWILVVSLVGMAGVYLLYTQANALWIAALLMAGSGLFSPLYRVGGDAMMTDLIPAEERADAFALLRMANNVGISIGPAIGGFLAATSYNFAFVGAAVGFSAYAVLLAIFARETLPKADPAAAQASTQSHGEPLPSGPCQEQKAAPGHSSAPRPADSPRRADPLRRAGSPRSADLPRRPAPSRRPFSLGGYAQILADRPFMYFIVAFTMTQLCATLIWVLLGVHAKTQYGVLENRYGLIPMTNAILVVLLQAWVTNRTKKRAPLPVLAVGTLIYAVACASVAFGRGFEGFWLSMVIMTVGELMLMPTSTTYTANLAPAHMRGRYMSVYSLTWNIAYGIGPVMGGLLSDNISPGAPWLGGGIVGLVAAGLFVVLSQRARREARMQEAAV